MNSIFHYVNIKVKYAFFILNAAKAYAIDAIKYIRYSRTIQHRDSYSLRASISAHYHVLEKGLSMKDRKKIFGIETASSLLSLLNQWNFMAYDNKDNQILAAESVLLSYVDAIDGKNLPILERIHQYFMRHRGTSYHLQGNTYLGYRDVSSSYLLQNSRGPFPNLVKARRSIRDFSGESVPVDSIRNAVKIAMMSPSVCNRQTVKVRYFYDKKKIAAILKLQNGNRGFGHLAGGLFIVSSDIRAFSGSNERNQPYFDAGLLSMSLMYSLTYLGFGSCPLNWCVLHDKNLSLRKLCNIPDNEVICMLLAVGTLPERLKLASSQRRELDSILEIID